MVLTRRLLPTLLSLAAATAAVAVPAAARADAPWSPPATIPGAAQLTAPLVVTSAGQGVALAAANRSPDAPTGAASELVPLGLNGAVSGTIRGLRIAEAQLATYASNRTVIAGSTLDARGTISDKSHVQVALGTAGGAPGTLRGLSGSTSEHVFALAADPAGDVAVVTGNTKRRRVLVRRPGSSTFRSVLTINVSSRARGATVAVGPQGDVLVVWEDDHHIFTRHIGRNGHTGKQFRVGDGVQSRLQAAIDRSGRELVAWASQRVNEGEASSPAEVFFVTAASGHGFGSARHVESVGATGAGRFVGDPAVRLVVGPDGTTTVLAWTGFDGTHYVARAAAVSGGHVGAAQVVSDPARNGVLGDLAVGPGGSAFVLWRAGVAGADPDGTPSGVLAAVRPAAAAPFGASEAITPAGQVAPVAPSVAAGPTTGTALALLPRLTPAVDLQVAARAASGG
jgi:hypothetical protein